MIVTRTPLRISLGGGGTDLPSYYRHYGGTVLSAAIDKYVYIAVNRTFTGDYLLKYSDLERVTSLDAVKHPLMREVLAHYGVDPGVEVVSVADIPAGTGLGSSGAFTVGLILAVHAFTHRHVSPGALAEAAFHIEMERLGDPVGKQDQYIASFGGITRFEFRPDESVMAERIPLGNKTLAELEDHLLLFFTGYARCATSILADQKARTEQNDSAMLANLGYVNDLAARIEAALASGDVEKFGHLMHEHWENKRVRSPGITSDRIDSWYALARRSGAIGGKLVGAGAGGFLLFCADDPRRLRAAMATEGLPEVRFGFDHDGAVVLARS